MPQYQLPPVTGHRSCAFVFLVLEIERVCTEDECHDEQMEIWELHQIRTGLYSATETSSKETQEC